MFYFTYKTTHINGKYYVGRHSTKNIDDNYFGSGKWVRSIKDKTLLKREIIQMLDNEKDLIKAEQKLLDENIGKNNCMNFNNHSTGFATGQLNPTCSPEGRKRLSERVKGDGNPAKNPETRKKMSIAQKNNPRGKWDKPMSEEGKLNISLARTGIKYSEEGRKKLSERRKREYAEGTRVHAKGMLNKKHSEETLKKMSESANKKSIECPHCMKIGPIATMTRWHLDNCKEKETGL